MTDRLYSLEATYYRTALLLGLVRGDTVHRWAEQAIDRTVEPAPAFFEIVSVPAGDLTGLRNALWPLVIDPEPPAVLDAIFGLLHAELVADRRAPEDTLTILRQMRSMLRLPPAVYAALNAILISYANDPKRSVIGKWLGTFSRANFERLGAADDL
jgi:hypothetical protein